MTLRRHPGWPATGVIADFWQSVTPEVSCWQAYDPEVKCDLSSCAIRTGAGLLLIDPIPLAEPALSDLLSSATPAAILLTNGNHARAADVYRARLGIPILASAEATSEPGVIPDSLLEDGCATPGGLRVVRLPGAGPGEIGLLGDGVLCIGDAIINLPPEGLRLLPAKYCTDPALLPLSLRKLLSAAFEVMTFAHGAPLASQARQRLAALLA